MPSFLMYTVLHQRRPLLMSYINVHHSSLVEVAGGSPSLYSLISSPYILVTPNTPVAHSSSLSSKRGSTFLVVIVLGIVSYFPGFIQTCRIVLAKYLSPVEGLTNLKKKHIYDAIHTKD